MKKFLTLFSAFIVTFSLTFYVNATYLTVGNTDLVSHERGGIEADISAIDDGDIVKGSGAGAMAILPTSDVEGDVLTVQADGDIDWQAAAGGGNTLDEAYDQGGVGVGRSIDADSGAVEITVSDTDNNVALALIQNDDTNDPSTMTLADSSDGLTFSLVKTNTGPAMTIDASGGDYGGYDVVRILKHGTGSNNSYALSLEEGTDSRVELLASAFFGDATSRFYRNISSSRAVLQIWNDNTGGAGETLEVITDNTADSVFIDRNNSGSAVNIDLDINDANDSIGVNMNLANAGAGEEFAFSFNGSEQNWSLVGDTTYDLNSKGNFTVQGYIQVDVAGTTYYMPYGTITAD